MKFNSKKRKQYKFRNLETFDQVFDVLQGELLNTLLDNQLKKEYEAQGKKYLSVEDNAEVFTLQNLKEFLINSNLKNKEDKIKEIDIILTQLANSLFEDNEQNLESMFKKLKSTAYVSSKKKDSDFLQNFKRELDSLEHSYNVSLKDLNFTITKNKFLGIEKISDQEKILLHFMSELAKFLSMKTFNNKDDLRDIISNRQGIDAIIIEDNSVKFIDNKCKISDIKKDNKEPKEETIIEIWSDKKANKRGWVADHVLADEIHSYGNFERNSIVGKINNLYTELKRTKQNPSIEEKKAFVNKYNDFINNLSIEKIKYEKSEFNIKELKRVFNFLLEDNDIDILIKTFKQNNFSNLKLNELKIFKAKNKKITLNELKRLVEDQEQLNLMSSVMDGEEIWIDSGVDYVFVGYLKNNILYKRNDLMRLNVIYQTPLNKMNKNKISACVKVDKEKLSKIPPKNNIIEDNLSEINNNLKQESKIKINKNLTNNKANLINLT